MSVTFPANVRQCAFCGGFHTTVCPNVDEIEYHENGTVKRVKLRVPAWGTSPAVPLKATCAVQS